MMLRVITAPPMPLPPKPELTQLAGTELLKGVADPVLAEVRERTAPRALAAGEVLLSPEQENMHVFLLLSGVLGLHFGSPHAPEVRELKPGTSVGEMSVIDATRPSAWVVAKGPCEVLPMHRDLVKRLIEETSPVARNLLHLMTHWIRANTDQIVLDQEQIWELSNQANVDPLTGLYNRRWLDNAFPRLLEQSQKAPRPVPLSVFLIDVDLFKDYNDTNGHIAGDRALAAIGDVLKTTLRPYDFSARYGGEEFLVLLPNTAAHEAMAVAERVRLAAAAKAFHLPDGSELPRLTVSIGVATSFAGTTLEAMVAAADESLYSAKREGRNRVVFGGSRG
jgi:diguanylate cyclase (GGDEF)-like protein